jgi:tetratricopeptide (TPR) repeat protein
MPYSRGNSSQSSGVQWREYVVIPREVVMAQRLRRFVDRLHLTLSTRLWILGIVLAVAPCSLAQTDGGYEARRAQAFALYDSNKLVDALPLLEKLHAERPGDVAVLERLSFSTVAHSATLADRSARKRERARARKLAEEAKAAGDESALLKVVLEIPEDGGEMQFSDSTAVQAAIQEGEAAFAKGEMEAAVAAYGRALALDPHNYDAALFTGDVYFKEKNHEQADKWFSRAVEIDPNRETAYRYWGDNLVAQGRASEAKEQFIGAVVAEPYNQRSWMGLSQWAKRENKVLGNPPIVSPNQIEDQGKNQTNITIDPSTLQPNAKKDGRDAWFSYTLFRAAWHGEKFQKEFPAEKEYRHSLPEEVEGLQAVVDRVKEEIKKKEIEHLDPALASLVKLSDEGLLESYILISRADKGISQDYATYRDAHREKVRQYIKEWIVHPAQ